MSHSFARPSSSDSPACGLPYGSHICLIYGKKDELFDGIVPFIQEGVENRDFCLLVFPRTEQTGESGVQSAIEILTEMIPNLEQCRASGQVDVIPHDVLYTTGGTIDPSVVLGLLDKRYGDAMSAGFQGVRVVGDTGWLKESQKSLLVTYEDKVHRLLSKMKIKAVCAYPRAELTVDNLMSLMRNHDKVAIRRRGIWEFVTTLPGPAFGDDGNRRIIAALEQSEARYRAIFDNAQDAILLMKDEKFIECNNRTLEIFGCRREDILDGAPYLFSPPNQPDGMASSDKGREKVRAALAGEPQFFEWTHSRKDGVPFDTEISLNRIVLGDDIFLQAIIRDVTERRKASERLRRERETFRSMLEKAPYGVMVTDKSKRVIYVNPEFSRITGYDGDDIPHSRVWFEKAYPDITYRKDVISIWKKDIPLHGVNRTLTITCKDGSLRDIEFRPTLLDDGAAITTLLDITERKQAEDLFRSLTNNSPVAAYIIQEGHFCFVNPFFRLVTGFREEELIGSEPLDMVHPEDRELSRKMARLMLKGHLSQPYEFRVTDRNGRIRWVLEAVSPVQYKGRRATLGTFVEITERKEFEEKLRVISTTDELTGLRNRRGFFTLAEHQMKIAERSGKRLLLFYWDLDNLKSVNDNFGHAEGDRALAAFSHVLRRSFRDADIIARVGGDEFAALVVDAGENDIPVFLVRLEEKWATILGGRKQYDGLSLSTGVAVFNPLLPKSLDDLIGDADSMMYEKKRNKPGGSIKR